VRVAMSDLVAAAIGAAGAVGADRAASTGGHRHRVVSLGLGLGAAAAVYPCARTGFADRRAAARELVAVASYGAVGVAAARRSGTRGHLVAAAGWFAHAAFDAAHGTGPESRLPSWYPAMCAGFDVVLAGLLVVRRPPADGG
jgi:hypothetical protein